MGIQRTLSIIKPDGVKRNLIGKISLALKKQSLRLSPVN